MYVACPHCGYLIALSSAQDVPTHCPRCKQPLQDEIIAEPAIEPQLESAPEPEAPTGSPAESPAAIAARLIGAQAPTMAPSLPPSTSAPSTAPSAALPSKTAPATASPSAASPSVAAPSLTAPVTPTPVATAPAAAAPDAATAPAGAPATPPSPPVRPRIAASTAAGSTPAAAGAAAAPTDPAGRAIADRPATSPSAPKTARDDDEDYDEDKAVEITLDLSDADLEFDDIVSFDSDLSDGKKTAADGAAADNASTGSVTDDQAEADEVKNDEEADETATDATAPAASDTPAVRPKRKTDLPSFVRQERPVVVRPRHWSGPVLIVALSLLLGLQLLLAQRQELAASASWRPVVNAMCSALPCRIPPWHEPSAFTMVERSVKPNPATPGVLRVSASFRNDARWAQAWPTLSLSLEDVDGRQVGVRAFAPEDYRAQHRPGDLLAPGQNATVQLDVIEPAPRIVAFTFEFR